MDQNFFLKSLQAISVNGGASIRLHHLINATWIIGAVYVALKVIYRRSKTTALSGPCNTSFIWGITREVFASPDRGLRYEKWAEEYGGVYEAPWTLGGKRIVLNDPKAIAHLFGREPRTYTVSPLGKLTTESTIGKGLFTATGDSHRRQRKILTPAFGTAAIRNLTTVFYDSAYKAKNNWDGLIGSNGGEGTVIEIQNWMNHISLDTIGIAGFSHDFGSLDGKTSSMIEIFDAFGNNAKSFNKLFIALAEALPWIFFLPTPRFQLMRKLNDTMGEISSALLTKSRREKQTGALGEREEKSLLGLLVSAENQEQQLHLTEDEVTTQAKVLLIAGYETTSIVLTWALIELCKNPDVQNKLREELVEFGNDPTFDQLSTHLPYLDAVVHETLRLHPPVHELTRIALEDDVIPLSRPVRARSGELVNHISVAKGTHLFVSVTSMNRSMALWGPDAKEFKPERWIMKDGIPSRAKEIQGHRHLLTFIDGPRTCLGRGFAIAEFKVVLSVLVKHFVFELQDGSGTEIGMASGLLPRPKVVGEKGADVPLRVRRFD